MRSFCKILLSNFKRVLVIALLLCACGAAYGGTIIVMNTNDSGVGSLRKACADASVADTIRFNIDLIDFASDTIKLDSVITLVKPLVIKGLYNESDTLFISGNDTCQILNIVLNPGLYRKMFIDSLSFIDGNKTDYTIFGTGGAVYFDGDSLSFTNSLVRNCRSLLAGVGGLHVKNGFAFISNSHFEYNEGDDQGAFSSTASGFHGSTVINDCVFTGNISRGSGGAIYVTSTNNELNSVINNCIFINNDASTFGGGIYAQIKDFSITNCLFQANTGLRGGGISFGNRTYFYIDIMDCDFINNSALEEGGGIQCRPSNEFYFFDIDGCLFENNTCVERGGGVLIRSFGFSDIHVTMSNSQFANNTSGIDGGGFYFYTLGSNSCSIDNCLFDANECLNAGGGLLSMYNTTISNSRFLNNSAARGGGICSFGLTLNNCQIENNLAENGGGIGTYYSTKLASITVNNSQIFNNYATTNGGGIYVWSGSSSSSSNSYVNIYNSTIHNNTAANLGGGIYNYLRSSSSLGSGYTKGRFTSRWSTFYMNHSDSLGGAIYSQVYRNGIVKGENLMTIEYNTFANNSSEATCGSFLYCEGEQTTLNLISNIVAFNNDTSFYSANGDTINMGGFNIFTENAVPGAIDTDQLGADLITLNLGPLQYNGGGTKTLMPEIGSVAINTGSPFSLSDAQNWPISGYRDAGAAENVCFEESFDTITACGGFEVPSGDLIIESSGTFTDTIFTDVGCDSLFHFEVTILEEFIVEDTAIICSGESYEFDDGVIVEDILTDTAYVIHFENILGCDSNYVTHVQVNAEYSIFSSDTICSGESFTFHDDSTLTDIEEDLVYVATYLSVIGCDSTHISEVIIKPTYAFYDTVVICQGDFYTFIDGENVGPIYAPFIHESVYNTWDHYCDSIYHTKVEVLPSYIFRDTVIMCYGQNFTRVDGSVILDVVNELIDTLSFETVEGCDSLFITEINLFESEPASIVWTYEFLLANPSGVIYQWVDCNLGMAPLVGENAQILSGVTYGNYAVVTEQGECFDTSGCYLYGFLSLSETQLENLEMSLFPNPAKEILNVSLNQSIDNYWLRIIDPTGKTLQSTENLSGLIVESVSLNVANLSRGTYYVILVSEEFSFAQPFVKE